MTVHLWHHRNLYDCIVFHSEEQWLYSSGTQLSPPGSNDGTAGGEQTFHSCQGSWYAQIICNCNSANNCSLLVINSVNIFIFTFNWLRGNVTYLNLGNRLHKWVILMRKLIQSFTAELHKIIRLPTLHASFIQQWQLRALSSSLVQLEQSLTNDNSLYLVRFCIWLALNREWSDIRLILH